MATRIQVRRDNAADWNSVNPTLAEGEIGYETDTGKFKIGNGSSLWSSLDYFLDSSDLSGYLTASSASTTYLSQSSASTTYLTQASASTNYLTQASASTDYLTQASASTDYLTQASASTNYLSQSSASTTYLTQSSASTTYAPIVPTTNTSFRNAFINGGFAIYQRWDGFSPANQGFGTAGNYGVDRWYGFSGFGNLTGLQVAGTAPNQFHEQITGVASNTGFGFGQRIEAANSFHFAGQTATVSISAASSSLTSLTWSAFYANTKDSFGTFTVPTRTLIATGTWTINSTLTRYSATMSIPAAATTGIEIVFTGGALLAAQTVTFAAAQFEVGSLSPFEHRPNSLELALCQRYYYRQLSNNGTYFGSGFATSTTVADVLIQLPVPLRAAGTLDKLGLIIDDGVTAFTTGSTALIPLSNYSGNTFTNSVALIRYTHGTAALTQFRPYRMKADSFGYFGISSEL